MKYESAKGVEYEAPTVRVIGSVADLTRIEKQIAPTSDGIYLHPGHIPINFLST